MKNILGIFGRDGSFITISLLFFSLQFPSLRDIHKFLPGGYVWIGYVYLALMCFAYFRIMGVSNKGHAWNGLLGLLESRALFVTVSLVLLGAVAVLYPHIDGLKYIGRGSDQDDSIISGVQSLLKGNNPYATLVPLFNNPRSPGPGWLVVSLPLTAMGVYHLFGPLSVILAALLLRAHTGTYRSANLFVLLLSSSIFFWDMTFEASDFLPLGCILVIMLLALFAIKLTTSRVIFASILLGMIATSRVPFLYLPLLYGAIIYSRNRNAAALMASLGTATAIVFHLAFYLWCKSEGLIYQPFHVLTKGGILLPFVQMVGVAILCIMAGLVILRYRGITLERWLFLLWLGLITPLFMVSIADLVNSASLTGWEGANYFLPPLPAFIAHALLKIRRSDSPVGVGSRNRL